LSEGLGTTLRYAVFIGLRYSFSRKRQRFTAVIAGVSLLGMVLGVSSLLVVLSVMNGFAGELRGRILSLVPHGFVDFAQPQSDWHSPLEELRRQPGVLAAAPYISDKVLLTSGRTVRGAVLTGIDPHAEVQVSRLASTMRAGSLDSLLEPGYHVVLGASLARLLGVQPGDSVQVTTPRLSVTPLGVFPRSKLLYVSGVFEVGAQPDTYQAYVGLATAQTLLRSGEGVDGLQVRTTDLYDAPRILAALVPHLPDGAVVRDWSQTQGSLFRAVRMEKLMVAALLLSVVAVAAFNIVSTLAMSVAEKRRDIAVLRTMGVGPGGVLAVFLAHGLALALVGITIGVLLGVLLALNIAPLSAAVEAALGVKLFDPSVYFISALPADLQWPDVLVVTAASLALSLLASVYPAWRAARISPAAVLQYE